LGWGAVYDIFLTPSFWLDLSKPMVVEEFVLFLPP